MIFAIGMGHTKELCYVLVGYSPGHGLYNPNHIKRGCNGKHYEDNSRGFNKPSTNLSDGTQVEESVLLSMPRF